MPQTKLPFFPEDIRLINSNVGYQKKDNIVYYFNGSMPLFQHPEKDIRSFRLYTSQLVVNGNAVKYHESIPGNFIKSIPVKSKKF